MGSYVWDFRHITFTVYEETHSQTRACVFLNFAVYTLIEYLASWILELGYSLKVTAYSDYLFTLNEHTYIGGSAVFALLGCAFLYYLAPKWTEAFSHLKKNIRIVLCILLSLIFLGFVFKISLPYIW